MTKQTKLQLVQINAALAADNEALRKQVGDMGIDLRLAWERISELEAAAANDKQTIEVLDESHQAAERELAQVLAKPAKPAYVMPAWQAERAAAMAAAKALAMATGRVARA